METLFKALPSLAHSVPVVALGVFGYLMDRFLQHSVNPAITRRQRLFFFSCFVVLMICLLFGVIIPNRNLNLQPPVAQKKIPNDPRTR